MGKSGVAELDASGVKKVLTAVERLEDLKPASKPEQLEFFDKALFRITNKEHERSLETITKELIRMGIPKRSIATIIKMITDYSEEIKGAAEQIDHL